METVTTGDAIADEQDGGDGSGAAWTARTVLEALARSPLDDAARHWVVAALYGDSALDALSSGGTAPDPGPLLAASGEDAPLPASAGRHGPEAGAAAARQGYLSRIDVQGFRGIGRPAALTLRPAAGLTVVVGRNGSGKSSFAEAAEAALTGRNARWDALQAGWRDGWRNLHYADHTEVSVDVHFTGDPAPTRITRTWEGASVRSARGRVVAPDGSTGPLRRLGWGHDLDRFRPFLSYDELGRAVNGRAAELYDTLTALLGLTGITETERALAKACARLARMRDRPRGDLDHLSGLLRESSDPRAAAALDLLGAHDIALDRLAAIAADDRPADPEADRILRRLRRLAVPERALITDVVNELRGAAMEIAMAAGTKADRARGVIALLNQALEHHERHPGEADCPACGTAGALGGDWVRRARAEVARLDPQAQSAATAYQRADAARDQARFLMAPRPSWLPDDSDLGRIWEEWAAGAAIEDLGALADHIEAEGRRLRSAALAARKEAARRLDAPDDGWTGPAEALAAWVEDARAAITARGRLAVAEQALEWFSGLARSLREERLRPLARQTEHVWHRLRQERHIDLESLRLAGRGARRRVEVDVAVDGADAEQNAPGLLSQGEFQALALSICLPRTLAAGNPFGFLVLDDPVQSMDTETVEGLAGVLAEVGAHRQIVVFTHDTRLPEALYRLGLPADVRGIERDAASNVRVADPSA
ncbi:AAA family ATPase [Nocardiopsis coralliicola]